MAGAFSFPSTMLTIVVMAYDVLLTLSYTDCMAAMFLRMPMPVAMESIRLDWYRHEVEVVLGSNYSHEALQQWGTQGAPWREVSQAR